MEKNGTHIDEAKEKKNNTQNIVHVVRQYARLRFVFSQSVSISKKSALSPHLLVSLFRLVWKASERKKQRKNKNNMTKLLPLLANTHTPC